MGVIKRGNSKFWYIQFQFQNKTHIRSSRTTDKKSAIQMEMEWRKKLHDQEFLGMKERISIRDAVSQFCNSKKGTPNYKNLVSHTRSLENSFQMGRYLDEIKSEDLERLKQDRFNRGCAAGTLKHTFNLIRGSWKYAKRLGYMVSDFEYPEVKAAKHRLRYLSIEEEKRLLKELDIKRESPGLKPYADRSEELKRQQQDNCDLVVVLLDTGARYTEISDLEWSQVDLKEQEIRLWRSKVENESVLYMTDRVYRILHRRRQYNSGEYVFTNKSGHKRGYVSQAIRKAFRRAGLDDCTIHTLRHTHATRLIQNGMSIYEVKEILGHADIKTTMRYAHLEQRNVSSRARDIINKLNTETEKPDLKIVKKKE